MAKAGRDQGDRKGDKQKPLVQAEDCLGQHAPCMAELLSTVNHPRQHALRPKRASCRPTPKAEECDGNDVGMKQKMTDPVPVFDGHNDIVLKIAKAGTGRERLWLHGEGAGHLDLPRMLASGFAGGFFAVYIPSPDTGDLHALERRMDNPPYDLPLPELIDHKSAQPVAVEMLSHLLWMERVSDGRFRWCRTGGEVRAAMAKGVIAGILHFEGAEPIGPDLDALHLFHALGLRSLGPVWSRPTIYGHGVPFRFPSDPDTGPGLTPLGRDLVRECNRLKIMLDLSHLNDKGFWDVAELSDAPLVATHSNAHAVCPTSRNLTDRQLRAIAETGGMVGLNLATCFLRPDGRESPDMTLDPVKEHIDHMLKVAGESHVGIGSDFDGATTPKDIGGVEGLPVLIRAMHEMGLGDDLVSKIAHGNWLRVLERTFGF
jgi:membrane dipeptidase